MRKYIYHQLSSTIIDLHQYKMTVQQNLISGQNVLTITIQTELQCSHHCTDNQPIVHSTVPMKVIQPPSKTAAIQ
jgi:hypothetical protein